MATWWQQQRKSPHNNHIGSNSRPTRNVIAAFTPEHHLVQQTCIFSKTVQPYTVPAMPLKATNQAREAPKVEQRIFVATIAANNHSHLHCTCTQNQHRAACNKQHASQLHATPLYAAQQTAAQQHVTQQHVTPQYATPQYAAHQHAIRANMQHITIAAESSTIHSNCTSAMPHI